MYIAVDARMIDNSGIGVYLRHILKELVNNQQVILLGNPDRLSVYKSQAEIISLMAPIYSIAEQFALQRTVPKCDVFWAPHYNVPIFPIRAKKRLVTIHDVYHLAFGKQLSLAQRAYAKLVMKAAVKLSHQIITVSQFSKSEIIKYTACDQHKINVIYNGVEVADTLQTGEDIMLKYSLPSKYILYVGNVKPYKNLRKLLQGYLLLGTDLQREYKIVIVGKKDGFIVGDPELFDWIAQTENLSDSVIFTGFVADEDMGTIYNKAAVFAFPSLYEGFGLPPLEAMLHKCMVIASDRASIPEVCDNAALYFDPLDEQQIAHRLTSALTNIGLRDSYITKGTARVADFTWEKSFKEHQLLFEAFMP